MVSAFAGDSAGAMRATRTRPHEGVREDAAALSNLRRPQPHHEAMMMPAWPCAADRAKQAAHILALKANLGTLTRGCRKLFVQRQKAKD